MHVKQWFAIIVALVALGALTATPAAAGHGSNGEVCIVADTSGPDGPLNAAAAEGAKDARSKLHVDVNIAYPENSTEVQADLDSFVTSGQCDLIIGIGFEVGPLMVPFIDGNPSQNFVIIDSAVPNTNPNLAQIVFLPNEAAFLAGYVAAGVSETGKVGVFGGIPFPPVTLFMDGYALGVEHYNLQYGADVEVLGWDPDLQSGLFTFTFTDPVIGQATAAGLYDLGADTVFPVAGFTSFGALTEAEQRKAAGESVRVIGVDFDWSATIGDANRVILTSVVKDYGPAIFNQIEAMVGGTWSGGVVLEGLESGAVDIAPFHKLNQDVPGHLKSDLKVIRAGIIDGTVPTTP